MLCFSQLSNNFESIKREFLVPKLLLSLVHAPNFSNFQIEMEGKPVFATQRLIVHGLVSNLSSKFI